MYVGKCIGYSIWILYCTYKSVYEKKKETEKQNEKERERNSEKETFPTGYNKGGSVQCFYRMCMCVGLKT